MKLPMFPHDKANHLIYGLGVGYLAQCLCVYLGVPQAAVFTAPLAATTIGVLKEAFDHHANAKAEQAGQPPSHTVSYWDGAATGFGGLIVGLSLFLQGL